MARYGYTAGGAPAISPAQKAKIDAHFAWQSESQRLAGQCIDLLRAGRIEEFSEMQIVLDSHRAAEPSLW